MMLFCCIKKVAVLSPSEVVKEWSSDSSVTGEKKGAALLILSAAKPDVNELFLINFQINKLPRVLEWFTHLNHLVVPNNQFTSLPIEIGLLTNLTHLDVSYNRLLSLPTEIGRLTNLTALILKKNELTSLPKEIGLLTRLKSLDLNINQLHSLPQEIGQLTSLTEINLVGNNFTSLPTAISRLTRLTILSLSYNDLSALPMCLGHLPGLTTIDIERTRINAQMRDAILQECRLLRDEDPQADEILRNRLVKWGSQIDTQRLSDDQKKTLNEWLLRLEKTKDFVHSQSSLMRTVCSILADVSGEFQELFFSQAEANNACCEDRAAMALNEIYTSWMILCKSVDLKILTGVAKTLCLRKELQKLIKEERESVEIFLYYESTLRERLNLVTAIQSMRYGEIGKRKWIDVEALVKAVNENFFDHLLAIPVFDKLAKTALEVEWEAIERRAQSDLTERPEGDEHSEAVLTWCHQQGELMQERDRAWKVCVKRWYDDILLF